MSDTMCIGCSEPVVSGGHICEGCLAALVTQDEADKAWHELWKRREKVWSDALMAEIAARKAAEAALEQFTNKQWNLLFCEKCQSLERTLRIMGNEVEVLRNELTRRANEDARNAKTG